ncbi:hypothetical protein Tco_0985095 [Tanacetum coccineum]
MKGFQDVLELFSWLSSLKVNFAKTAMFGVNISEDEAEALAHYFNCSTGSSPFEFLGVLIGVVKQLERFRKNFLWGVSCSKTKIPLMTWSKVCLPRQEGGLGIMPLRTKNIVLLAKWWCRYNDNKTEIWKALIKCHYGTMFPEKLIYKIDPKNNPKLSQVWNGILSLQKPDLMASALGYNMWKWKCGNGERISFWYDIWASDESLRSLFPDLFLLAANRFGKVSEFYVLNAANECVWRIVFSRNLLPDQKSHLEALFRLLHRISIQPFVDDMVTWKPTESSDYSTNMAYELLHHQPQPNTHDWVRFMWTKVTESVEHVLLHCKWAFLFWGSLLRWWNMSWVLPSSISEFVQDWNEGMPANFRKIWKLIGPYAIWQIWLARNEATFNDKFFCWSKAVTIVKRKAFQCGVVQKV